MGVLNVTPDSFYAGSRATGVEAAVRLAREMERAGADILDIGAESTRPGSAGVTETEELARLLPVLKKLRGRLRIPVSVDTRRAAVAEAAADAGAAMLNDVSALRTDPAMGAVAKRRSMPVVLMHLRGEPRTMQKLPFARDVLLEVTRGLREAVARARRAGLAPSQIVLDPGIGFGKSFEQNYELLARLPELARLGYPLLVGTSRKTFIGATLGAPTHAAGTGPTATRPSGPKVPEKARPFAVPPEERAWGTAATVTAAILGGAHIVRVHDVAEMRQVALVADALLAARQCV